MKVKGRESRVESRKMRAEGGGRKAEGRFRTPHSHSPFPLPPSPFRLGITLTEVLISIGILTLGLLGVAALFPVGSFYMQRAEIADSGSAIAQRVMNDLMTRGMLDPRAWYTMTPVAGGGPNSPAGQIFPSDGKYSPLKPPQPKRGTYTRPFALTLNEALTQPTAATDRTLIGKQFGSAFVIDPMGVAAMAWPTGWTGNQIWNGASSTFPASAFIAYFPPNPYWRPWANAAPGASGNQPLMWPVRRMTFRQPSTGWQMDATMAEHYFRAGDDLATDLPQRPDRPAQQLWDTAGATPLARQWTGDYSWIVTVAPTTNAARDGMARNPEGHAYDVSVVVFHKRALPPGAMAVFNSLDSSGAGAQTQFLQTMGENERAVKASVVSTGLNGGELLLEKLNDSMTASPFDQLRIGQWIMLCGPNPNSSTSEPRFVLNWYQVMAVEGRNRRLNADGTYTPAPPASDPERRLVALRGPQWPWQPRTSYSNQSSDVATLSDNLCVGIFRGAVAVHSKTMRLERGSGMATFGSGGDPTINPPPWTFY